MCVCVLTLPPSGLNEFEHARHARRRQYCSGQRAGTTTASAPRVVRRSIQFIDSLSLGVCRVCVRCDRAKQLPERLRVPGARVYIMYGWRTGLMPSRQCRRCCRRCCGWCGDAFKIYTMPQSQNARHTREGARGVRLLRCGALAIIYVYVRKV